MSSIRGRDTIPELLLRRVLHGRGYRYSLRYRFVELNFRPDIVLVSRRICIFVDGCFWHRCPVCFRGVKSNRRYWNPKLKRNVERDAEQNKYLMKNGWRIIRVWEHEIRKSPERTLKKVIKRIEYYSSRQSKSSLSK